MTESGPDRGQKTQEIGHVLAIVWIGIVMLVGICILLAIRWDTESQGQSAARLPSTPQEISGTPQDVLSTSSSTLALAVTGAPGMPPVPTATAELTLEPTALPVEDRNFGYGIEVNGLIDPDRTLDLAQQLGMGWIKQTIRWTDVEPQPGNLDWALLDALFAASSARRLKVLVTVTAAPDWARSVTAPGLDGPPNNAQPYVNFVTSLVQRYRGAIHAIEIWSEMNLEQQWYTAGGINSADYMNLLIPTARAIHTLDPGIIVISGGLNPTGIDDGVVAIDDFRYMQEMINAGVLDYVDCIGVHHKGYNLAPDVAYDAITPNPAARFQAPFENPHHSWSFYSTLRGYNDFIVTRGQTVPLCVTAFGWASASEVEGETEPAFAFAEDNTPLGQANYIVQAFQMMHDWGFVWMAFVFNLDSAPKRIGGVQDAMYSLLMPDGTPRPAFEAVRAMPKQP